MAQPTSDLCEKIMSLLEFFSNLPVRVEVILGLLSFLFGLWTYARQQVRLVAVQKQQTYQRLELASNDLFRFTASNAQTLVKFEDMAKDPSFDPTASEMMVADNHIFQTLNLFEMAARLRHANFFDDEIFRSWVIWYYGMLTSWYFREIWDEIRPNYTKEMHLVFDEPVSKFDPAADDTVRKKQFFIHVAKELKCPQVRQWVKSL